MNLRVIVSLGLLAVLGFLFYPRGGGQKAPTVEYEWIPIKETLENERLHGAPIRRDNPVVQTYDLGYIYSINSAEINFSGEPRDYDILVSAVKDSPKYDRVKSASAASEQLVTFPPREARWVQVVINDWTRTRPKINSTKIGARYRRHHPVKALRTRYNPTEASRLIDDLKGENAPKWIGGRRSEKEVEKDKKIVKEVTYESPGADGVEVILDLGIPKRVYGIAVTTGGGEGNLKQYEAATSVDGKAFKRVYESKELENKTLTDSCIFPTPNRIRNIQITIPSGGWYGAYPEITEVEVYTDRYRRSSYVEPIENHNAIQIYYDNCGMDANRQAPYIVQGFPFDRGVGARPEDRYLLKPGDEVDAKNSARERSFCYHYDRIEFRYPNLDPEAMYWAQVTYLQEKNGNRIQSLDVDGFLLHDAMQIPADVAKKLTFAIPPEAYADGEVGMHFNRIAGPNAVVSEVTILQASKGGMLARVDSGGAELIAKAPMADSPIVVDGLLDEWPLLFPIVPEQYSVAPSDSPCQMYVQWDSTNLYIALKANRGKFSSTADASDLAQSPDALHIFVDSNLTRSPGMYRTGDHHFRFFPIGMSASKRRIIATQIHHHLDAIPGTMDNEEIEVASSFASEASEYILEARIPRDKALYEFSPQPGSQIGFNYILTNPYSEKLFWSASDRGAPPVYWGKLELVGTVRAQLAIMDENLTTKRTNFNAGEALIIAVWDPDRNTDRNSSQSIKVRVSGNLTKDSKEIVLSESSQGTESGGSAENSDLFVGKLPTRFGIAPGEDPNTISVQGGEHITIYYVDPYYGPNESSVEVTSSATVNVGTTANMLIETQSGEQISTFSAGDKIFFRVEDKDLVVEEQSSVERAAGSLPDTPAEIAITVESGRDVEKVILFDDKNSGIYTGSIATAFGREGADDGILQLIGERIKATYLDPIQANGNTNVPVEAYAMVKIGSTGRLIIGKSETGDISDFTTIRRFSAGDSLLIFLTDRDINTDSSKVENVEVRVKGDSVGDSVVLNLTETESDSDTFMGVLRTAYSLKADESSDILEVKGNENITITYKDDLQATGATGVEVSVIARVEVGTDGSLSILRSNYLWDLENFNAGDAIYFRVEDADLNLDPEKKDCVSISVVSENTKDNETLILEENNPDSGDFFGYIVTQYFGGENSKPKPSDNILQVQGNEKVTAIYMDKLRVTGETNVPITDSAIVNAGTTGRILVYNKDDPYNPIAAAPELFPHSSLITHYPSPIFRAGDTLIIQIEDMDLNIASTAAEIFQVSTVEDVIRDSVPVILIEATGTAGVFRGEVKTEYGIKAVPGDGILQVQGEGMVSISYTDALRDTGETNFTIKASLTVETGHIGIVEVTSSLGNTITSFNAGDTFTVRVKDLDLNLDPGNIDSTSVIVQGNILEDKAQILLRETEPDTSIFDGRVDTEYATAPNMNDTALQVIEKEVVTISYTDEVGVTGETNIPISVELIVRSGIAGSLLIVDENHRELPNFNAGRKLYFRLDDFVLSNTSPNTPARITVQSGGTMDTEEVLVNEIPGEQGIYIGSVPTSYGTTPVQDDVLQVQGGQEVRAIYYPQTPGTPSTPIVDATYTNKGTSGEITITGANGLRLSNFNVGGTLYFRLEDMDQNLKAFAIDTAEIRVTGNAISSGRAITLKETAEDSGVFTGSIETRYGRRVSNNNILEVVGGEQVTAVYYDALTSTGETDVKVTDSSRANMLGTAKYSPNAVLIDGDMAGWPLENALRAGDERSNLYLQWDKDYLYILAYVADSEVVVPDPTRFWDGTDAIELHIDTDPARETSSYLVGLTKPSYYFFWFCPKGAGPDGSKPYVGQNMPETVYNYTAIETSVKITPDSGYVLEARIPFATALGGFDPYKTAKDDSIGFNYIIRRSSAPQLRWALGAEGETGLPPSFFGTLILEQPGTNNR